MLRKEAFSLGVDTSCYTTSVAAFDPDGRLAVDERIPLSVAKGGRGLAQSEMVFQHVNNLPELFLRVRNQVGPAAKFSSVAVTDRPRPVEDSYMPVFRAGLSAAVCVAVASGAEVWKISHQENHILAGLWSAATPELERFLAVHMSGGTTEIVAAERTDSGFSLRIVGGTRDLHAGQLIDRVGVKLGLPFPAGPHLEKLAEDGNDAIPQVPVSVEGGWISFSGPETYLSRQADAGTDASRIAAMAQYCVAESLTRALHSCLEMEAFQDILLVGGVAANQYMRRHIQDGVTARHTLRFWWPEPHYAGDNAVGAAYWAWRKDCVQ